MEYKKSLLFKLIRQDQRAQRINLHGMANCMRMKRTISLPNNVGFTHLYFYDAFFIYQVSLPPLPPRINPSRNGVSGRSVLPPQSKCIADPAIPHQSNFPMAADSSPNHRMEVSASHSSGYSSMGQCLLLVKDTTTCCFLTFTIWLYL